MFLCSKGRSISAYYLQYLSGADSLVQTLIMGQRYGLFVGPNGLANNKGAFLCPYLPLHCVHHQHTGIILDAIAEEVHDVGPKAFKE